MDLPNMPQHVKIVVREAFRAKDGITVAQIAAGYGLSLGTTLYAFREALMNGWIVESGRPGIYRYPSNSATLEKVGGDGDGDSR